VVSSLQVLAKILYTFHTFSVRSKHSSHLFILCLIINNIGQEYKCVCVCVCARARVCMYVCKYVCTYVHMYVCMYVRMYACMYVRMYVCMYVCIDFNILKILIDVYKLQNPSMCTITTRHLASFS